jgi:hypothetical protein
VNAQNFLLEELYRNYYPGFRVNHPDNPKFLMKSSADGPRSSKSSKNDNKASAPQMNPLTRQGGDDPTTVDPEAPKRIRPKVKEAVPRQSSFKKAAPQAKVETKKKKEEGKIRRASRR